MDQAPLKRLDTPLAVELAETVLLKQDLETSVATIRLWYQKYADNNASDNQEIIGPSLFRDAVVQFIGCFHHSTKHRLSAKDIYGHRPGGMEYFRWLKDLRDAYAAHKFGSQRQCVVGIAPLPSGPAFGHFSLIYTGPQAKDGPQLEEFMNLALTHTRSKIKRLQEDFLKYAKTLTPEQINTLPEAIASPPKPHEVRMSRSEFQASRSKKPPVTGSS